MSADSVRDALATVRAAGSRLRKRDPEEVVEVLGDVLTAWRDPTSAPRRALVRELPGATGFSEAVVERGLALALAPWTREAWRALWRREAGAAAVGFETTAVLLAGAIPMPTLLALLAPLVLRSGVVARAASRDRVTARHVVASLHERDAELANAIALVEFETHDLGALDAFVAADCVVATGSDETVAAVGSRARGHVIARGHRLSVAVLGESADLEDAAHSLALDVALWDQLGCLSPVAVFAVGGRERAQQAASALARALESIEQTLPRGVIPTRAAAMIAHERSDAELRAAARGEIVLHVGEHWTVVAECDGRPRSSPLHRFVRVHPVANHDSLTAALAPYSRHLAAIGCAGVELSSHYGASRVCALGTLQAPPLDWHQDGIGVLAPLVRR